MKDIDWKLLTKLQDDLVKNDQIKKKQRQNYHKLLYKNELQKMIAEKRIYEKNLKQQQKKMYNQAYKSLDHETNHENKTKRLYTLVKQNSDYNYNITMHRKTRELIEVQQDKQAIRDRLRRVETEQYSQRQKQSLQKQRKKKQLAEFYENQINYTTNKKYLQKLENRRFQELAKQMQTQKQKQRTNMLNKIRYGYHQNPETFNSIKNIYNKNEEIKEDFLKRFQSATIDQKDEASFRHRNKMQQQINQTSKFNRNCFLQKQLKKQQNLLKTIEDDNNKIISIQQQISEQNQQQQQKRKMLKFNLKTQLEHQIHDAFENKVKWKKMNENQLKINQPYTSVVQPISIPGLYKDYKDIKREQIMQKFLVNQKYSLPTSYHSKILLK